MTQTRPVHYNVSLSPQLDTFSFSGHVEIHMTAETPVSEVCLNALELTVNQCVLVAPINKQCTCSMDEKRQEMTITLPEKVSGEVTLAIDYTGEINNKMAGFYRSTYRIDGKEKFMALTQFQESDARRALPCFDHPAAKATYDLAMVIDDNLTAISNCPVKSETRLDNHKKKVVFDRTPHMSSYLFFFGVGEFEFTEDTGDVTVRVACMPGKAAHARFGMDFGRKSLEFCETYFDVPFPLPKVDLIAISDFAFGAMENWGAITFRENLLLHYDGITSKSGEESITSVIAHEMTHQWFGNLVTPSDWKYLWLNESFATYFGYGVVDHYYPEWDMWDRFMEGQTKTAMERDAMHQTFPIELPGGEHVIINASTAPIIYNKGGSILRQIKGFIGEDAFREGLRAYLKKFAYDCAASHHLWESLEAASGKPITKMMQSWIEQPGYPVIEAEKEGDSLKLAQKRFSYLPETWDQTWSVPVTLAIYRKNGATDHQTLMLEEETTEVSLPPDTAAYKINTDQTGFYRVRYPRDLAALGQKVADKTLSAQDRWGLQNDLYGFVKSTDEEIDTYLNFLAYYKYEDAYLPLASIAGNLSHARLVYENSSRKKVEGIGKSLMTAILAKIGYDPVADEPPTRSMLRDQVLYGAAAFGAPDAINHAMAKFEDLQNNRPVHPDIARGVMLTAAAYGDEKTFKWFTERLAASESEHERMNILTALGTFREASLIEPIREFILAKVPDRNRFIPITAMGANVSVCDSLWGWFVNDLERFETFHPMLFDRVVTAIVPVGGLGREGAVRNFFDAYMAKRPGIRDVALMAMELMEINAKMRKHVL